MSSSPYISTRHASAKMACLFLGLIVTFASYFAYNNSPWNSENLAEKCAVAHGFRIPLHWNVPPINASFEMDTENCPALIMERFFVFSNMVILAISSLLFIVACISDLYTVNSVRRRDATYHVAAAVVLLVGAVLQLVSTHGVESNKCTPKGPDHVHHTRDEKGPTHHTYTCGDYFHHQWKYVAAAIGFVEAFVYLFTACIVENVKLHGLEVTRHSALEEHHNAGPAGHAQSRMSVMTNHLKANSFAKTGPSQPVHHGGHGRSSESIGSVRPSGPKTTPSPQRNSKDQK